MLCTLADLTVGDSARVRGYADDGEFAHRLMSLGLIPGTEIVVKRRAPLGDPVEIDLRGFRLALRPRDAACLQLDWR